MSTGQLWLWGCIGGLLPIIVRIAKSAFSSEVPNFYKWWLIPSAIASAFLGGLLVNLINLNKAAALTGFSLKLTVVLVGYAAPNILANLAGAVTDKVAPAPLPQAAAPPATFRRFLRA